MTTRVAATSTPGLIRDATTFLFVPGDRPARFDKAARSGADVVVLDLEDAVARENKSAARADVVRWLDGGGRGCVRVNSVDDVEHVDDIDGLSESVGLVGVMVPKADDTVDYWDLTRRLRCPVVALVESAVGLDRARVIAADPSVARLAFGHLDYAVDLGCEPTRTAMLHARSELVLASRIAGKPGPVDGVTTALDDGDVLADDLRHAVELGMRGKLAIHPSQIEQSTRAFRPGDREIESARAIVRAAAAGAAVRVDGHMVDAPVLLRARAVLRAAGVTPVD
ncbi:CoA ester lyase [Rhodococcus sp. BP-149]|uniref:HpcH/HpaI aldolase/citrate lyase family protein n=1 Tax=unclassified Rhodococcus (in: high G+C Gram-positive bacteria) TaxID=192944 RepID=UPI001C9AE204|nr:MULTISPECIES: CoA ester lyase [unclassified Rhodococcus (in: high G+C Gram-positive bacteria)]MBY6685605.1 CoA ester lyase [Rhodococcus sp. BP-288]MBY6694847.1 CoA ester lyase [Rhodococcus sp. BP-188]MBY6696693.1 CoA ester lyase [Rhodococcus sp. BP-285]MBY6703349.1 CoA ester lyase [Rhodococcus sp. BP-283]MBY6708672.1 CoA ester lyase [Rhodococcus sp. BP-241]